MADGNSGVGPAGSELTIRPGAGAFRYHAFGLNIHSEFKLPELKPATFDAPDLFIRSGAVRGREPSYSEYRIVEIDKDSQYVAFLNAVKFRIRDVRVIDVDIDPTFDPDLLGFSLLGPVMAVIVHLRGALVLHGSAIQIGDQAAIFLGDKGAGKSTTAGAMIGAGHALVTDDVVAIDLAAPNAPLITPAYPMVKLSAAALERLDPSDFDIIPTIGAGVEKQRVRLNTHFASGPVTAQVAYVLEQGERLAIEPLPEFEGFLALMRYSYITRFGKEALSGDAAGVHMRQCAQLSGFIRVARLVIPRDLNQLPDAVELVEQNLR